MGKSVIQEWVSDLTFMQQSVVLSAIRGLDGARKSSGIKPLVRYYRRCVLLTAFEKKALLDPYEKGGGGFTGPLSPNLTLDDIIQSYLDEYDSLNIHFHLHFTHAAEILGYKHPNIKVRNFWNKVYNTFVKHMHLKPETEEELDKRLGDSESEWLKRETLSNPYK